MQYTGEDYLLALESAKNYNAFIASQIARWIRDGDQRIIDFGAGNGMLARMVHAIADKDIQCLEPADNMRKYLGENTLKSLEEVGGSSVDFIYSSNVLEHIEDDAAVVAEMARVLKPGGRAFFYLPAFQCLFSSLDRKVGHYRRYDAGMLRSLFSPDVWRVRDLRYADSIGFAATLCFKLFGNRKGDYPAVSSLVCYDRLVFPLSRLGDKITCGKLFGKNVMVCAEKCRPGQPGANGVRGRETAEGEPDAGGCRRCCGSRGDEV